MKLKRIAYTVNVFPKFSETFIANEIAELKRRVFHSTMRTPGKAISS